MSNSKFRIKRDISTTNAPHPDQLDIGELVINAVTGKLYSKLVNGKIIEFIGQQICYDKTPSIIFSDTSKFCCIGDLLTVTISDLRDSPIDYVFEIEDLSNNSITYSISDAVYSKYIVYPDSNNGEIAGTPVTLRKALVPISISISGSKSISILKFKVLSQNQVVAERTISISCRTC